MGYLELFPGFCYYNAAGHLAWFENFSVKDTWNCQVKEYVYSNIFKTSFFLNISFLKLNFFN